MTDFAFCFAVVKKMRTQRHVPCFALHRIRLCFFFSCVANLHPLASSSMAALDPLLWKICAHESTGAISKPSVKKRFKPCAT